MDQRDVGIELYRKQVVKKTSKANQAFEVF